MGPRSPDATISVSGLAVSVRICSFLPVREKLAQNLAVRLNGRALSLCKGCQLSLAVAAGQHASCIARAKRVRAESKHLHRRPLNRLRFFVAKNLMRNALAEDGRLPSILFLITYFGENAG